MTFAPLVLALIAFLPDSTRGGEPVMLDFTATWCGPCRSMKPAIEQLARGGIPIKAVDIDRSPELAERYKVTGVPCFVVIDPLDGRELARTSGAQPAARLVELYRQAKARHAASATETPERAEAEEEEETPRRGGDRGDTDTDTDAPNPKPWETVVRIKVHGQGFMGFGSGTVIASTPKEALILTCAHIFKLEGRSQAPPSRFPMRITVDLFDGKLSGTRPAQVHYANETFEGQAIDYDFGMDVGLIRIRPGRRIPYAKVVPPHWTPKARMQMTTVGCSEGHDATAWSTLVVNPKMKGLNGNGAYEAIVCTNAPKQGRSGGGLFTSDGYVAGVCDFAEPTGNHGLYAAPDSIYKMLDRNRLTALYDPNRARTGDSERLIADGRGGAPRSNNGTKVLGQSPEPVDTRGSLTLPPPEMLDIKTPTIVASGGGRETVGPAKARRQSWHPSPASTRDTPATDTADLRLDPGLDPDRFDSGRPAMDPVEPESAPAPPSAPESNSDARRASTKSRWRAGRTPLPSLGVTTAP